DRVERVLAALDHAVDGVDGLVTRDLSGRVPAHSVGDDVQTDPVVHEERVLVGDSPPANVREPRAVPAHQPPLDPGRDPSKFAHKASPNHGLSASPMRPAGNDPGAPGVAGVESIPVDANLYGG